MLSEFRALPGAARALIVGDGAVKVASMMSLPFLALFLSKNTALPAWAIGVIIGLSPLAQIFGGFFAGQLSDRMGRLPLFIGSCVGLSLASLGFYLAASLAQGTAQFVAFAALSLALGLLSAVNGTLNQALLSDWTRPEQRAYAYHWRYTAINLGAALGPAIGARVGLSSSAEAFLLTAVFYALFLVAFLFVLKKRPRETFDALSVRPTLKESLQALGRDRKLFYFILAGVLFNLGYCQMESTLSQHLVKTVDGGLQLFSNLLITNCLTVVVFQLFSYRFVQKIGMSRSLFGGSLAMALGFFVFAFAGQTPALYFLAMFIATVGEVFVFGPSSAFLDQLAPDHLRGTYFGAANFKRLGASLGPVLGGFLLDTGGGMLLFLTMTLVALASAGLQRHGESISRLPSHSPEHGKRSSGLGGAKTSRVGAA